MPDDMQKHYDPKEHEGEIYRRWLEAGAFRAVPDGREKRFVVMMPLPNVTGALHMGHALDNVMQDLLVRWHRMMGHNTLWMPGTDHAGIATQAVVETRLLELEGKTRHDLGRSALISRIWEWTDARQKRIIEQQQRMGCSCDWERQRFTMDAVCTAAVRETFFRMFRDGLVFRGNRLVNWDCYLQTAVADDEVYHETVAGHFWHIRYAVVNPKPGEPEYVVVATTRPETMLGDTAVACHPEPAKALASEVATVESKLRSCANKEREALELEISHLKERIETLLPQLQQIADMARDGRLIRLPLANRDIPLITDEWAKPQFGTGCVKITPAHDPNDYEVWQRHRTEIEIVNLLNPDGTFNEAAGSYAGQDRFKVRERVIEDLKALDLLERIEQRDVEIGHSDRSKTPVEPYLSKQWFVRMGDVEGGVIMGRGTPNEHTSPGFAQAAMDALRGEWRSPTGRKLQFHPDPERYGNTYFNWLAEKRDWCISRQLWWGHQIPIWSATLESAELAATLSVITSLSTDDVSAWIVGANGDRFALAQARSLDKEGGPYEVYVCPRNQSAEKLIGEQLTNLGLKQDPDALDTWFSSALWPHSTLGWPNPENAPVGPHQTPTGSASERPDALAYYYPGSCLVTGRDIITLWVARMVIAGLYNLGDLPFTDSFIHANIVDGRGERMSKSKGNGIDPADIIDRYGCDAMRYIICDMQTGTQDIRLPVQAISPYTQKPIDLATANHGRTKFTYICPDSGKEFDVIGTMPDLPSAVIISDRFEVGRSFCTKLWNATRFTLMSIGTAPYHELTLADLELEDRWILSRLTSTIETVHSYLQDYNPSGAIGAARDFFWNEFCDWYLELVKPRTKHPKQTAIVGQILALILDQSLRLLHPFVPFVTETLWSRLCQQAPIRGLGCPLLSADLLVTASWPAPHVEWRDLCLETDFSFMQAITRSVRETRSQYNVAPRNRLTALCRAEGSTADVLRRFATCISTLAALDRLDVDSNVARPRNAATVITMDAEIYLVGVIDPDKERERISKQRDKVVKSLAQVQLKLNNDTFIARAPAETVEAERQKAKELDAELAKIDQALAEGYY